MQRPLIVHASLVALVVAGLSVGSVVAFAAGPAVAAGHVAPLALAAQQNDRPAIKRLLAERVDVNASQADGMTALLWAAYRDDLDLVDQLLRAGANVRSTNRYGVTPLSLACTNGNAAMVERLLGAGADPNTSLPGG